MTLNYALRMAGKPPPPSQGHKARPEKSLGASQTVFLNNFPAVLRDCQQHLPPPTYAFVSSLLGSLASVFKNIVEIMIIDIAKNVLRKILLVIFEQDNTPVRNI